MIVILIVHISKLKKRAIHNQSKVLKKCKMLQRIDNTIYKNSVVKSLMTDRMSTFEPKKGSKPKRPLPSRLKLKVFHTNRTAQLLKYSSYCKKVYFLD